MKIVAAVATLFAALMTIACVETPRPVAKTGVPYAQNGIPELRPKEGLSFKFRSAADGANTNGSTPVVSSQEFAASDGTVIVTYAYSFSKKESADKFYSDTLARASKVLHRDLQPNDPRVTQRAVIEFMSNDGQTQGGILLQGSTAVTEITGPSVGHVLAFEQWWMTNG